MAGFGARDQAAALGGGRNIIYGGSPFRGTGSNGANIYEATGGENQPYSSITETYGTGQEATPNYKLFHQLLYKTPYSDEDNPYANANQSFGGGGGGGWGTGGFTNGGGWGGRMSGGW